ncbi:MAG: cytochrome c biogenesis protein CcsA [Bacteroidales bacterium]
MRKFKNMLFSMELTGMLLILFAIAIGFATFIENDFGTITAKAKIYNAKWFEILLLLLAINMTGSIFKHKMHLRHKWPILLFHVAFLVIFIGAAITRYIGYEGMMGIREGQTTNEFISDDTYIRVWADDGLSQAYEHKKVLASPVNVKKFKKTLHTPDKKIQVTVVDYITKAAETYVEEPGGEPMIWLVLSGGQSGRQNLYLNQGQSKIFNGITFAYEDTTAPAGFRLFSDGDNLYFQSDDSVNFTNMMAGVTEILAPDTIHRFLHRSLYSFGNITVVLKDFYQSAVKKLVSTDGHDGMFYADALIARVTVGEESTEMPVFGGKGLAGNPVHAEVGGVKVTMSYGSKVLHLPFSLKLEEFQLERYPGSNSPSSYASEVVLIDERKGLEKPYRIYMNNVLNYGGYRFFQSSYDKDEKGTVLSVNRDSMGTIVTYLGYFLMTLGMIVALFWKNGRIRVLTRLSSRLQDSRKALVAIMLTLGMMTASQSTALASDLSELSVPVIKKEHAERFGRLLIQDHRGRIKPINTQAAEVLRKVSRKTIFDGQNPDQVFLGIMAFPETWDKVPMIRVNHPQIQEILGIDGRIASFSQIVSLRTGEGYKLGEYVEKAYAKKPAEQSKFDQEIIKVDERVNIFYMVYTGLFLNIFPIPGDENNKWVNASQFDKFTNEEESAFVRGILSMYFNEIEKAVASGNWESADEHLDYIMKFQRKYGEEVMPSPSKVNRELLYNRINFFKRLTSYYGLVGFILLVMHFSHILNPKIKLNLLMRIASVLIFLFFLMHTAGLIIRWSISGHAPWSNGYESMIYIAWATILSGLIFMWRSPITLAVTALLASLTLAVAGLNWMDPEITTLVPVLDSYWLIIHVAIITASYGFLALGALLGFFNLLLINLKTRKNHIRLNLTITELGYIIEMTLVIGLFMLTIGTFLGGVWANESWGRYWGWDPKETWALVTVLVYSFILHMRFIPGFRGNFALSFSSLIGFGSVIMTYFGVNYYLSGLHSYAAGDPLPVPSFVYYTIAIIALVGIWAYFSDRKFRELLPEELD